MLSPPSILKTRTMYVQIQVIKLLFRKNSISLKNLIPCFQISYLLSFATQCFGLSNRPIILKEIIIHITVNAAWYPSVPKANISSAPAGKVTSPTIQRQPAPFAPGGKHISAPPQNASRATGIPLCF